MPEKIITDSLQKAIDALPGHCQNGVRDYIVHGQPVGGFLTKVFENDLHGAFSCADENNQHAMLQYAAMLHWAPIPCWGSPTKVAAWIKKGGLVGK